jgi:drug/metabolite transporter (DMT)-like permease
MTFSRQSTIILFTAVILAWAANWPIMKVAVDSVGPAWVAAYRFLIAAATLFVVAALLGALHWPVRSEWPIILWVSSLQMGLFTFLTAEALTALPAGRSAVIAFATPLWVAPAAALLLGEKLSLRGWIGVTLGLLGLSVLALGGLALGFSAKAWGAVGMLVLASIAWAVVILVVRRSATPETGFALVPWQAAVAAVPLTGLALVLEGLPPWPADGLALSATLYVGLIATAFAFWATMLLASRVSAVAMAVGMLGVPALSVALSIIFLAESPTWDLLGGVSLVVLGIALTMRR